jgi:hypothetical protein
MAVITFSPATIGNWELSNNVVLRIYALESFVSADGNLIPAGVPSEDASQNDNFFVAVACTAGGATLTIASFTLESTTDALFNPSAKYGAYFFTNEGQNLGAFGEFAKFMLPASPTTTQWAVVAQAQGEAQ